MGANALQGPHHGAQKSTKTAGDALTTSASKESSVTTLILSLIFYFGLFFILDCCR
ncbi:hypothetical protein MNB_SUP05-SYMBIONT-4-588 [hydrothermal vent metagenome]|uniref:Uncharacterized protein n=1 Tax=hydrothermal vent metagenome TaxID=652676 RepID=A0A1W1DZT7_9ZZZZ